MDREIQKLRKEIDRVDVELVRLLSERAGKVLDIGRLKLEKGLPIVVPQREVDVITHTKELNEGPLEDAALRRIYDRIIDEMRRVQRQKLTR